jgi:hypothetical protein
MVCLFLVLFVTLTDVFRFVQTGSMDSLDEKPNGAPPMEIDEVVSVRDRQSPLLDPVLQ